MSRRRRRKGGFKLNVKTLALIAGAYLWLTRTPAADGSVFASTNTSTRQQSLDYWANAAGEVIRAPGYAGPPGYPFPASDAQISNQGVIEDYVDYGS